MKTYRTTSRIEYNEAIKMLKENNTRFSATYNKNGMVTIYEITIFEN